VHDGRLTLVGRGRPDPRFRTWWRAVSECLCV